MKKNKSKYYVVWNGYEPGIYKTWTECQQQIKGFPGARYKAFATREDAENAFFDGHDVYITSKAKAKTNPENPGIQKGYAVDAACSGNPGDMEYRGIDLSTNQEIFRMGVFRKGTNNIGEFLAIVHALALLKRNNDTVTPVYTDSRTAISWVKNKKVKTNLTRTKANIDLFNLVERGIKWLKSNHFENQILKWDTKNWGEIPADFGRK
jgi:ribonuclease HI